MITVESVWLAVEPLDMRSGTEAALARVVHVFDDRKDRHQRDSWQVEQSHIKPSIARSPLAQACCNLLRIHDLDDLIRLGDKGHPEQAYEVPDKAFVAGRVEPNG